MHNSLSLSENECLLLFLFLPAFKTINHSLFVQKPYLKFIKLEMSEYTMHWKKYQTSAEKLNFEKAAAIFLTLTD